MNWSVFDQIYNPDIKKEIPRRRIATFHDQMFIQLVYSGSSLYCYRNSLRVIGLSN